MTISDVKQRKLDLAEGGKRGVRTQFGALCWRRRDNDIQVLLVTSRRRKRWIIPKGWPQDRTTPSKAALTEAWEEAGVEGKASQVCLGIYSYNKELLGRSPRCPAWWRSFRFGSRNCKSVIPNARNGRRKWFSLQGSGRHESGRSRTCAMLLARFDPVRLSLTS